MFTILAWEGGAVLLLEYLMTLFVSPVRGGGNYQVTSQKIHNENAKNPIPRCPVPGDPPNHLSTCFSNRKRKKRKFDVLLQHSRAQPKENLPSKPRQLRTQRKNNVVFFVAPQWRK
jgi:hypothetical protein